MKKLAIIGSGGWSVALAKYLEILILSLNNDIKRTKKNSNFIKNI